MSYTPSPLANMNVFAKSINVKISHWIIENFDLF